MEMEKVYLVSKAMLVQPFSICVSGNFLKNICPERHIEFFRKKRSFEGHFFTVTYHYTVCI